MTLARACRDHEHVDVGYTDRAGTVTSRRCEPYRLVTTGRRWYLLAFDRDRQDWRSLRLDRMSDVTARGSTFVPRDAPDAATYVQESISTNPYPYVARVRYFAPQDVVAQYFSPTSVSIEPDGPDACILTAGADDPDRMLYWLMLPDCEFEIIGPDEVISAARALRRRLAAAIDSTRTD